MKPLLSKDSSFLPEEPLGESLLQNLHKNFRIWVPKSTILVLGRSQKLKGEINTANAQTDNIPIFRRQGGGGCVLLDGNSICVAFRYSRNNSYNTTPYFTKSSKIIQQFLLNQLNLECQIHPNYDLSLGGKKLLGASLYMPKSFALYLAVILIDKAKVINKINRYLHYPSKSPNYRQNRSHDEFLTSINEHTNITPIELSKKLQEYLNKKDLFGKMI